MRKLLLSLFMVLSLASAAVYAGSSCAGSDCCATKKACCDQPGKDCCDPPQDCCD